MTVSAWSGPIITFGNETVAADYNPEGAASLFFHGTGYLDHRSPFTYYPGQNFGQKTLGWLGSGARHMKTIYGPPVTKSTTLISGAGAHITAATAMTLISSTVAGAAVGVTVPRSDTNVNVTGLIALDPLAMSCTANLTLNSNVLTVTATGTGSGNHPLGISPGMVLTDGTTAGNIPTGATIVAFGTGTGGLGTYIMSAAATATASGDTVTGLYTGFPNATPFGDYASGAQTVWLYNPKMMISRAVSITSTTSQVSGINFVVNGLDVYGYPMSETITTSGTSATTTNGKKAFKYIKSVTPDTTDGTGNYSVGTLDIVGLPIRSEKFQVGAEFDVALEMNNAVITSTTGYTTAVLTTATATTGDVRGTYALQTASDGTLLFGVSQTPFVEAISSTFGIFGIAQYTAF
jgi:hypothetical protein